jgi:hypothetical protein
LKISTPLILVSTSHDSIQILCFWPWKFLNQNKKITQINLKNAYLPTLPLRESITGTTPFFLFGLILMPPRPTELIFPYKTTPDKIKIHYEFLNIYSLGFSVISMFK